MGYCTVDDVAALNKARAFDTGKNPTTDDVQKYIDMVAGDIDAVLVGKGYTVPVDTTTYPEAGKFLNGVNAKGAWAMSEASSPTSPNLKMAQAAWTAARQMLVDARQVMDIPLDTGRTSPRGPGLTRPPQPLYPGDRPFFRRHMEF
jgi:hypothetical protein